MIIGKRRILPYVLLIPAFGLLIVILFYPLVHNIYLSLWNWQLLNPRARRFVGLQNYSALILDQTFIESLTFTLLFTFSSLTLSILLGLLAALLLNSMTWGRRSLTAFLMFPYMIAPVAVGLAWRLIWARTYGLANYFLDSLFGLGLVPWLAIPFGAKSIVAIAEVWQSFPFSMLVFLAALTSIPQELYEAARVDGATSSQEFRHITLPLILPALTVILIFQTIFKFRVFALVFSLTGGGPGTSTTSLGILLYRYCFRYFDGGRSATLAVTLTVIGLVFLLIYMKFVYREVEY